MAVADTEVAIVGGGVVGCAVAHALARRGVQSIVLEAEPGLALAASGTNSGILHTGFDSPAGELETRLILRSAALREELWDELGIARRRCGARLTPRSAEQSATVARLAAGARANGIEVALERDGSLLVPGETVTDPVAFAKALAAAACAGGARVELDARVVGMGAAGGGVVELALVSGRTLRAAAAVNCAGLYADEIARMGGDRSLEVYPRKGEFLVFEPPEAEPLREILLPVPSSAGKGVLVFPTLDGMIVAGPTARDRVDKTDWTVEADAAELIRERAEAMYPPLAGLAPRAAYAGLRPAGRDANYVIGEAPALRGLINVAAIRSTGLSASLAIGELVTVMLAARGRIALGAARVLAAPPPPSADPTPWWARSARHRGITPAGRADS